MRVRARGDVGELAFQRTHGLVHLRLRHRLVAHLADHHRAAAAEVARHQFFLDDGAELAGHAGQDEQPAVVAVERDRQRWRHAAAVGQRGGAGWHQRAAPVGLGHLVALDPARLEHAVGEQGDVFERFGIELQRQVQGQRHRLEGAVVRGGPDAAADSDAVHLRLVQGASDRGADGHQLVTDHLDAPCREAGGEGQPGKQVRIGVQRVATEDLVPDGDDHRPGGHDAGHPRSIGGLAVHPALGTIQPFAGGGPHQGAAPLSFVMEH